MEQRIIDSEDKLFQVMDFIKNSDIVINSNMLLITKDGQTQTEFLDLELKNKFMEYHDKMANLRIVEPNVNLSLGGSQRIRKPKRPVTLD